MMKELNWTNSTDISWKSFNVIKVLFNLFAVRMESFWKTLSQRGKQIKLSALMLFFSSI